ncbi:hypothetical protein STRAU_6347 [Streptomyces aurantiacus JA 4570]|uniref:Uncharacterized protein n=1 Tax=Streptomyces aurantiacus JA 4570 TaxID=1286094 RepID=S4AGJ5_9ACTN|nr:hypothetical protein STRAU_6347 [Streptomyces aurantiacus JA 4570]
MVRDAPGGGGAAGAPGGGRSAPAPDRPPLTPEEGSVPRCPWCTRDGDTEIHTPGRIIACGARPQVIPFKAGEHQPTHRRGPRRAIAGQRSLSSATGVSPPYVTIERR